MGSPKTTEVIARDNYLLGFETVKRWLGCETIKASATRSCYLYNLDLLVKCTGMNPDQLIQERIADMAQQDFVKRQRIEQVVREFKGELTKESESKGFLMTAAVCSFFKANTGARLNINNPPPDTKHEVFIYEGEPSGEQDFWRRVVDHAANVRDAAAFLIGLEAGPRDGSLLAMTIGNVTGDFASGKSPYKIIVPPPGESPRRKQGGFSFIAEDARTKVEAYLALRKARGFSAEPHEPFITDLQTGKPLGSAQTLNDALRQAFLDAGVMSRDQIFPPDVRLSPIRWYCLRKRTQTIMEDNTDGTGIALNWVDELLSHRKRGVQAGHYSKPTVPQLRTAWAKAMHRLMIYKAEKPQATRDEIKVAVMEAWNEMLSNKIAARFDEMENQIVTGKQIARLLRDLAVVKNEAEAQ